MYLGSWKEDASPGFKAVLRIRFPGYFQVFHENSDENPMIYSQFFCKHKKGNALNLEAAKAKQSYEAASRSNGVILVNKTAIHSFHFINNSFFYFTLTVVQLLSQEHQKIA